MSQILRTVLRHFFMFFTPSPLSSLHKRCDAPVDRVENECTSATKPVLICRLCVRIISWAHFFDRNIKYFDICFDISSCEFA